MKPTTLAAATATAAAVSALQPFSPSALCSDAPSAHPNIVYFLVDDMGFADCGFNGGTQIKTPNIDALSRRGVILENYYVQPLCSASRCSLMTGRMPNRHGIYGAIQGGQRYGLALDERILPQLLKTAGYTTAITGKWHCGSFAPEYRPTHRGWDHQYGLMLAQMDYFKHTNGAGYPDWSRDDKPITETGYSTHLIAQEAIRLIKAHATATNVWSGSSPIQNPKSKIENPPPLFLYIPFNAIHAPYMAPDAYKKPYANLPSSRCVTAAMLAVVDEVIGKVYATLVETGLADNTLIIFSSDNGGASPGTHTDNTPLRAGKGSIYEGGVRSSAFVIWPGHIAPGTRAAPPVHLVDWYPTLAALTGADPAPHKNPLDGQNILPLLLEGKAPDRDALLIVGTSPQRYALRMGDWKLLVNPNSTRVDNRRPAPSDPDDEVDTETITNTRLELYNLATDISEKHNLAATDPDRVKAMYTRAKAMMADAAPSLAVTTAAEAKTAKPKGKKR